MPPSVQQIEVTFDDAKGILNLSASDMATCKSNRITITNDKTRVVCPRRKLSVCRRTSTRTKGWHREFRLQVARVQPPLIDTRRGAFADKFSSPDKKLLGDARHCLRVGQQVLGLLQWLIDPSFIFFDVNPENSWPLRDIAKKVADRLQKYIEANLERLKLAYGQQDNSDSDSFPVGMMVDRPHLRQRC